MQINNSLATSQVRRWQRRLMRRQSQSDTEMGKDTVYRFLNSVNANWRKFLYLLSATVIKEQIRPLTSEKTPKVFILDDCLYNRNRSKKVELLAVTCIGFVPE